MYLSIYLSLYVYIYIYIYLSIYLSMCIYIYIYIYIHTCGCLRRRQTCYFRQDCEKGLSGLLRRWLKPKLPETFAPPKIPSFGFFCFTKRATSVNMPQKCTSKGIGRQSVALKHRDSLQKEPMPCRPMPLLVQL